MTAKLKTILVGLYCTTLLTSCLIEEPKKKSESVSSSEQYEKVIDDLIGAGSINPQAIQVGDQDTLVQTLTVSNSLAREQFRRSIKVVKADHDPSGRKHDYGFEIQVIQRDSEGNIQAPTTETRNLTLEVNDQGYYVFKGDNAKAYTLFSWDLILNLRGFCQSFTTEDGKYEAIVTCSNLRLTSENWGPNAIPVRRLTLNRNFVVKDLTTGATEESKLHYSVRVAAGVPEISKIVSFCSEGLQRFNGQVYYLVNCNNIESLQ